MLKQVRNGFTPKSCIDKKCLACYSGPPTLKSDVIKELGTGLCNLDPSKLTVDILQMKEAQPNGQNKWLSNSRPSK
jgi:hypothetical protein